MLPVTGHFNIFYDMGDRTTFFMLNLGSAITEPAANR